MTEILVSSQIAGREIVLNFLNQYDDDTFVDWMERYPLDFYLLGIEIMLGNDKRPTSLTPEQVELIIEDVNDGWRDGQKREIRKALGGYLGNEYL